MLAVSRSLVQKFPGMGGMGGMDMSQFEGTREPCGSCVFG